ncbi:tetratricopeptide repeat protein [Streptomyces virginiae]|uniref:tetratricopeptide repeat protein n=1 Tax=Streptomyces virginiae TaxID=1961 RepID=UPI003673AA1C
MGGRLVLTAAHVAGPVGTRVEVFHPGGQGSSGGTVVWCGTPGGRDDAALVAVDEEQWWKPPTAPLRWGRTVSDRPGTDCETWGLPDVAQRAGKAVEAQHLSGRLDPATGFVGNQYVMDLIPHPPRWSADGSSPWGGLSGAGVFANGLLVGVVASDRAYSGGGQLNVVPAYVLHHDPAFRNALAEHGADIGEGLEAVEFQHLADHSPGLGRGTWLGSPATLLDARHRTVPFYGRAAVLEALRAWCEPDGFGAWLLHGPGGQGKTRLAHQLAAQLTAERWAVLWPKMSATSDQLAELRYAARPLLIVLDHAETRAEQLAAIAAATTEHPGTTPLKLLLLARTDGDWWRQAVTATLLAEDRLATAPTHLLGPLEYDPARRADGYLDAARALAAALPVVDGLTGHDWLAAADALLPPPQLDQDVYGNALTLHMTALADLLDSAEPRNTGSAWPVPSGATRARAEVEDRLLRNERLYWRWTAAAIGVTPGLSDATLETALAAAHLVGAADIEQADRLWRQLPALADQTRDRRNQVTRWLSALYPADTPGQPWGALRPDRLAERHIGRTLDADPRLADHLLDCADQAQTERLMTVYSRAAAHPVFEDRLDTQLTALCTLHYKELSQHIISTATRTEHPTPLVAALDATISDPTTPLHDLLTINGHIPPLSRRLAATTVLLTETLVGHYRGLAKANPETYLPALASSLNNLAVCLGQVGRREEALTAIQEAIGLRRGMAEANADAYHPDLASSLNNLSVRLSAMGRGEEGLAVVQETVHHYRTLAVVNPDAYLPDLAACLNNLSNRLSDVGRREEALTAIQEAIAIRRPLAEANPHTYLPDLATSLNNLSNRLSDMGRREDGLAAIQEATGIRRVLAEGNPDAYLPDLATALNNLSIRLSETGRRGEGLAAIEEAVRHYHELARADPAAYQSDLASALNNMAVDLGRAGRREEALAAIQETADQYRALAKANPATYLPGLATALNNLSNRLSDVGRRDEGLVTIQEATGIRRALAEVNPGAYLPDLATTLNNLSNRLSDVGRRDEGLVTIQEATGIRRALAEVNPGAYLPDLAACLNNLSVRLGDVGRRDEGLVAVQETVGHYRVLAEVNPGVYLPDLATALNNLSIRLGDVGRKEEALAAVEDAIGIRRRLAEANPDAYLPDLASSLNNLAVRLGEVGRGDEALAAIEEGVGHYRALVKTNPDAHLSDLATALHNLAVRLGVLGRRDDGLAAVEECTRIRLVLAEANPRAFATDLRKSLQVAAWLRGLSC